MNEIRGSRLYIKGEGSWVSAVAARDTDSQTISVMLVNFDPQSSHVEQTSLNILHIPNGVYRVKKTRLNQTPTEQSIVITDQTYTTEALLPVNSVLLLQLTHIDNIEPDHMIPVATLVPNPQPSGN